MALGDRPGMGTAWCFRGMISGWRRVPSLRRIGVGHQADAADVEVNEDAVTVQPAAR